MYGGLKQNIVTLLDVFVMEDWCLVLDGNVIKSFFDQEYCEDMSSYLNEKDWNKYWRAGDLAAHAVSNREKVAALKLYLDVSLKGHPESMWNASILILEGKGVGHNKALAIRMIEWDAVHGSDSACSFLANSYHKGLYGKGKNDKLAEYWYQRFQIIDIDVHGTLYDISESLRQDIQLLLKNLDH